MARLHGLQDEFADVNPIHVSSNAVVAAHQRAAGANTSTLATFSRCGRTCKTGVQSQGTGCLIRASHGYPLQVAKFLEEADGDLSSARALLCAAGYSPCASPPRRRISDIGVAKAILPSRRWWPDAAHFNAHQQQHAAPACCTPAGQCEHGPDVAELAQLLLDPGPIGCQPAKATTPLNCAAAKPTHALAAAPAEQAPATARPLSIGSGRIASGSAELGDLLGLLSCEDGVLGQPVPPDKAEAAQGAALAAPAPLSLPRLPTSGDLPATPSSPWEQDDVPLVSSRVPAVTPASPKQEQAPLAVPAAVTLTAAPHIASPLVALLQPSAVAAPPAPFPISATAFITSNGFVNGHSHMEAAGVVRYAGVFLTIASREVLLSCVPARHVSVRADHMTLAYKPSLSKLLELPLGAEVVLRIIGCVSNSRLQVRLHCRPLFGWCQALGNPGWKDGMANGDCTASPCYLRQLLPTKRPTSSAKHPFMPMPACPGGCCRPAPMVAAHHLNVNPHHHFCGPGL